MVSNSPRLADGELLRAEYLAPFATASGKNRASTARGHTSAETVGLRAFANIWLVRALQCSSSVRRLRRKAA